MNENLIEFINYIQPILTSCSGFIRTDGYMCHIPGKVIIMSDDETIMSIINIPIIFNISVTAYIRDFVNVNIENYTENDKNIFIPNIQFLGWNIKFNHMSSYASIYDNIDSIVRCIYSEDDCNNIPRFSDVVSSSNIDSVNVSDGVYNYNIPASKALTPVTKSDSVSLKIYDYACNPSVSNIKTVRYMTKKIVKYGPDKKKKFKVELVINTFANILVV